MGQLLEFVGAGVIFKIGSGSGSWREEEAEEEEAGLIHKGANSSPSGAAGNRKMVSKGHRPGSGKFRFNGR